MLRKSVGKNRRVSFPYPNRIISGRFDAAGHSFGSMRCRAVAGFRSGERRSEERETTVMFDWESKEGNGEFTRHAA